MDIAIIGAGPYGLSLAAHLRQAGIAYGVFGNCLETWTHHMPAGMDLKSDGFASNLCAPAPNSTLGDYCRSRGIPYHDTDLPVPLSVWCDYAADFQRRFVPDADPREVHRVEPAPGGFKLILADQTEMEARFVVVAVGISQFGYTPPLLRDLSTTLVSHSFDHHDPNRLAGRRIAIIGAGASSVDLAVLAAEAGADVTVIARGGQIRFAHPPKPGPRPFFQRLRHPSSGMGPSLRSRMLQDFPNMFRFLPGDLRSLILHRHLGPRSAHQLKSRFDTKVKSMTNTEVLGVAESAGRVQLSLKRAGDVSPEIAVFDHVIAATGYRVDINRLGFLDASLRKLVRVHQQRPVLSGQFESSVAGLYFVGPPAADSFGPLMRFMVGAEYAAPKLGRHFVHRLQSAAR